MFSGLHPFSETRQEIEIHNSEFSQDNVELWNDILGTPNHESGKQLHNEMKNQAPQAFISGYLNMRRIGMTMLNRRMLPLMPHMMPEADMDGPGVHM